ncbi:MAG: phosphomethylpyrimidine synthase ThiC [Planctomycetales bacterium]|nr:phosphomethylpyrimidine synthase ThiC [Planctomycetales bacterium]
MTTQILAARAGEVTAEMKFVAERERLPVETILAEVASGRMVIPANKVHVKRQKKTILLSGKADALDYIINLPESMRNHELSLER